VGEGLDHIGVRTEDAETSAQALEKAGGRRLDNIRDEQGRLELAYVADPDGTWIELIDQPDLFPLD